MRKKVFAAVISIAMLCSLPGVTFAEEQYAASSMATVQSEESFSGTEHSEANTEYVTGESQGSSETWAGESEGSTETWTGESEGSTETWTGESEGSSETWLGESEGSTETWLGESEGSTETWTGESEGSTETWLGESEESSETWAGESEGSLEAWTEESEEFSETSGDETEPQELQTLFSAVPRATTYYRVYFYVALNGDISVDLSGLTFQLYEKAGTEEWTLLQEKLSSKGSSGTTVMFQFRADTIENKEYKVELAENPSYEMEPVMVQPDTSYVPSTTINVQRKQVPADNADVIISGISGWSGSGSSADPYTAACDVGHNTGTITVKAVSDQATILYKVV